ncbi:hypothetical protein [Maribellus sediminis]|uniref:hypothetical protein n=1 Tax=Maribellus sediminis TaxID=2696285 RepID=UPI001430517E|nr:hypothetical protein [Maribellus sediminis]
MAKRFVHIISILITGFILLLLTAANASAQISIDECDTMEFSVLSRATIPEPHYVWAIYNTSTDPVNVLDKTTQLDPDIYFVDGMYASGEGSTVKVTGLPVGFYLVRINVWDEEKCTDNVEAYLLEVKEKELDFTLEADSVCIGEPTTVRIIFTGVGPYTIQYTIGDAVTPSTYNLNGGVIGPVVEIPINEPLPVGETPFWIMEIVDGVCKTYQYTDDNRPGTGILIYPKPAQQPIYLKED